MYHFSYKLTYNESPDDDLYRKQLLDVFFLKEYDGDKINNTVNNIIKPLIKPHFKEVFEYKKGVPVKSAKFDKASIYEKMLPSIALVVVLLDE